MVERGEVITKQIQEICRRKFLAGLMMGAIIQTFVIATAIITFMCLCG